MCGRFALTLPHQSVAEIFDAIPDDALASRGPRYNICPTQEIEAVYLEDGARRIGAMRWGFIPHWYKEANGGPLLINARSETLAEKPAFKAACRDRRCLILATGFYEWTKDAEGARFPWYFTRRDGAPIAFAGIWQDWGREDPQPTCAIVTTAANARVAAVHHRMPLILEPEDWPLWLGEAGPGAARLMRPGPEDALAFYRVDPAVNSNRARGAALIEALPDAAN